MTIDQPAVPPLPPHAVNARMVKCSQSVGVEICLRKGDSTGFTNGIRIGRLLSVKSSQN